ncbi:MAG: DUF2330 domain-containing protein [Deltaproteobacteria bacterium]|nr:DUF2330 domain-containing protein [Deltaproteobacteria bacterium]
MLRPPRLVRLAPLAAAALGLSTFALPTPEAQACGGFFCSQVPVDQAGEQIIFGMQGDTITAQILISYTGEAEDFAWLLPVASTPEVTLGTMAAFQQLGWRTRPTFNVQWTGEWGQCGGWWMFAETEAAAGGGPRSDPDDDGVQVVSQKDVGPFETTVLAATDTDALVKWLDDNDYDQPPAAVPLLDHYVRQGMQFVALRLLKDEPTGAIQPITLTFREADPCVPLVLTQIAAVPDMPVQLYLFGDHRVVPTNWFHVVVNQRKIDWVQYGSNYADLVTQAVDEAAGHGFVTEYAGPASITKDILYREGQYDLAALERTTDPAAFVMLLLTQGFPRDALMQKLLRQFIPMPQALVDQGVTEQQFYNNLEGYSEHLAGQPFDPAGFVDALEERVITPMRDTQALFDAHPKLTRLYTTVSEDEMNRDPVFAENPDLEDVSNVHTAQGEVTCDGSTLTKVSLTLPDGSIIDYLPKDTWPYVELPPELVDEPAAARIELVGRTGPGVLVDPAAVGGIDAVLDTQAPEDVLIEVAKDPYTPPVFPPRVPSEASSGGCAAGGSTGLWIGLAAAWMLSLALGARRFRRR